jgi:tight adherence protein B
MKEFIERGITLATDYNTYHFTKKENIICILQGILIAVVFGYVFYQSIIGVILLLPLVYFYRKGRKARLLQELQWRLNLEFRDSILSLSAALTAGYSAENALEEAYKDLCLIYPVNTMILKEFTYMINQVRMNITVEKVLTEFGERTGMEDIISFAEVFATAKRTGGDLVKVIKTASDSISDKIEVKREIVTMIAGKRLEANIMKIIPLLIISYLIISSPGFLKPLYHNLFGIVVMTILLCVYLGAYLLIEQIISIEV